MDNSENGSIKKNQSLIWKDKNHYPVLKKSSYRHWAWEFLKRNDGYREACRSREGKLASPAAHLLVKKFGRRTFKSFNSNYSALEDSEQHWLAEAILKVVPCRSIEGQEVKLKLSDGEVALVFDLTQAQKSGKAALTSLLSSAKKTLSAQLELYEKRIVKEERSRIIKPRRAKLLLLLRLYDAKITYHAPEAEIFRELYPAQYGKNKTLTDRQLLALRKKVSADLIRAKDMVRNGYLSLIPLDYIQEKSS
jgi:hypothetical protein